MAHFSLLREESQAASTKLNQLWIYDPAILLLYVYLCIYRNLHIDSYSSFIPHCPNVEATEMSLSRWMDKLWYSRDNGILAQQTNEQQAMKRTEAPQTPQMPNPKWKKPIGNGYMYNSGYMTFWKTHNYGDNKKISSCQGLGREGERRGMNRWNTGNCSGR